MSSNLAELIDKISVLQGPIWQTTTALVSEAADQAVNLGSPLTTAARPSDLFSELSGPMMVIQFSFATQTENTQVVLIPQETVSALSELIQGTASEEIDENIVADLRAPMEAIVQGICLGVSNLRSEMLVASGLSIRFQVFSFPPSLQRCEKLVRTQVAMSADDMSGSLTWLMDVDTAQVVLGHDEADDGDPFPMLGESNRSGGGNSKHAHHEDLGSLEMLYDVPLEITVELGRVKMMVREVLDLGNGSVVEIDKAAGEPVDVMVNGRLMARGEVVVIEDNFGVRITEIVNPADRHGRGLEAA